MRIGPPRAHEDGLHVGVFLQVELESLTHGQRIVCERELVGVDGVVDKGVDLGKGVWGDDVDGGEAGWEWEWRRGWGRVDAVADRGEEEVEENETVFAAVVGDGQLFKTVAPQCQCPRYD